MNQESERRQEKNSSLKNEQLKSVFSSSDGNKKLSESSAVRSSSHQNSQHISLFNKIPFSLRHFEITYWKNGIVWGVIVGSTVIFSASFGVALTKINRVEQIIARVINTHFVPTSAPKQDVLARPVNILLVEVEPAQNKMLKFPGTLPGESKTILLLRLNPQQELAQAIDIPVDSRVKIPGIGWGTIADAHRYGNISLVSQLVEQLLDDITIDRYVRATPVTFQKLLASGRIYFDSCNPGDHCNNPQQQIERQQKTLETIRQRLNSTTYFRRFENTLVKIQPDLDTNLSLPETMVVANYVKKLPTAKIEAQIMSGYTPTNSRTIALDKSAVSTSRSRWINNNSVPHTPVRENNSLSLTPQPTAIAVQNTTDSPELAIRFLTYLRQNNFQDVYLVEQIPLRLNKTKIITNQNQLAQATYLKNFLGLGRLRARSKGESQPLTIQIGDDARELPFTDYSGKQSH